MSIAYMPADFGYYGKLPEQLFAILSRYSLAFEVYSIDEGFIDLSGLIPFLNQW